MSQQITTAMVDMFSSNVMHLVQQDGTRLLPYCRMENFNGESKFFDRIGLAVAKRKEGRHSDVIYEDIPHTRRQVVTEDFYAADMVDKEDKLRILMNPESEYTRAIGMALGRQIDEEIIAGALGSAYGGKKGTVAISIPNSQKLVATDGVVFTGLNVATLRKVRKKFKQNEAIRKGGKLIWAQSAQQADDLLGSTEVTSTDFNSVRALVNGESDSFMGFKFVETELLPFNATAVTFEPTDGSVGAGAGTVAIGDGRRCIAFTENSAILCALPSKVNGRISELPEKHYSHQVYGSMTVGTTRMEEEQLMEIYCKEV